ncbi:hypothetical protein B5X24_HaOG203947 [Helicoverpa armigera]|uniref:FLYWCH-type domain-containing protein n=1 Tax=Helicoverpa armigera TaxID=29058 RepID=A0A2W1BWF0_HELAM|nr:hypothetical protein B5X24_HaOG203947 [Helicoverpa armigera]
MTTYHNLSNSCAPLPTQIAFTTLTLITESVLIVKTNRKNPLLCLGPYKFNPSIPHVAGIRIRWRCNQKSFGCKASVITVDDLVLEKRNEHNH